MKRSNLFSGIFWGAFGVLLFFWATRYEIRSLTNPGPGFWPLILGVLLVLLSLILLLGKRQGSSLIVHKTPVHMGYSRVICTVFIFLIAIYIFEKVGYLLTVFFFVVSLMWGVGVKSWKRIAFTAFLSSLGVFFLFVFLLKQPLPKGLLRF